MPEQTRQRARLNALMEDRRLELRMRWRDVATSAGITYETLRAVRRGGQEIRDLTKRAIEDGLLWERGSVDTILKGGDPVPLAPSAVSRSQRYDDPRLQEVSDAVADMDLDPELKAGMVAFAIGFFRQQDTAASADGRRTRAGRPA